MTDSHPNDLDGLTRFTHLGLAVFGLLALGSGFLADDYKAVRHPGYTAHIWLGMGAVLFGALRLLLGIAGPRSARFTHWVPWNPERLVPVWQDLAGLLRLRLPERNARQGLAGMVEALGLLLFFLMSATGGGLYLLLEPGRKARGLAHFLKEVHEGGGEALLPLFFAIHGGAVLLHALAGRHLWRRMLFLRAE